ncbi:MAG: inorganic phosphate transporter [Gammaproteobacteria bacterium]|nr:MAG: inorganic phosphate transporter [Gammaproteobacteria bacterium]
MTLTIAVLIGLLLAYANGANDNFKGVATLYGSGTTSYRTALVWATVTTGLGSVTALFLAGKLLAAFSGAGLVPPAVAATPGFALAVALAAASTVGLATRFGFPISTTHSLIGGLIGAGLLTSSTGIDVTMLGNRFMLPLIVSPFLAILITMGVYPALHGLRNRLGVGYETCICIGQKVIDVVPGRLAPEQAAQMISALSLDIDDQASCRVRYQGTVIGISARSLLDGAHFLSAGMVSFARGLNDTPKIAALLLVGNLLVPGDAIIGVGAAIAFGGWMSARRVAETLSHGITTMNPGQGFTANIVTGALVIGASNFGLPVSTTHVSCGALFGIGTLTRQARWKTIGEILLAWAITLPVAGLLGAAFALMLT